MIMYSRDSQENRTPFREYAGRWMNGEYLLRVPRIKKFMGIVGPAATMLAFTGSTYLLASEKIDISTFTELFIASGLFCFGLVIPSLINGVHPRDISNRVTATNQKLNLETRMKI